MGGFFSPPSAPVLPPPPPPVDTGEEERKRRVEAIERRRRGRAGTVATSERGVLDGAGSSSTDAQSSAIPLKDKLGD
jgi:hypothetical protein